MTSRSRLFVISLIIGTLSLVSALLFDNSQPVRASDLQSKNISISLEQSQKVVINFYYGNQDQLNAVASRLDIWEVHQLSDVGSSSGYAVAAVNPAQIDWLKSLGYHVEINQEKTVELQSPTANPLDPRYYYFDIFNTNSSKLYMVNFLQDTTAAYPGITELLDIGDAWLATQGGYHRDILVLRITNEDSKYGNISSKPTFFLFANIHAREVTTPEMAIRYIKYMTAGYLGKGGYGVDPDVTWLVNHHVVYIMVSINPDGRVINEADINAYWRKNVDKNNGCSDPTSWGTDINRNSNFYWSLGNGSSGLPCDETYRGPSPASEPETVAFQTFAATIFQDWNGNNGDDQIVPSPANASGIFITLHAYADDVLWPFGFAPGAAPNNTQLRTIGRKLAAITGRLVPTGYVGYPTDGTSDDWIYGHLGVAAFTYEIGPNYGTCGGFFPSYNCQDGINGVNRNFWAEMRPSFIYADKIAATPYITAYGPDTQNLLVNPNSVPAGLPVNLSSTVLDLRYSTDPLVPIAAAEYFIDTPGTDGTGIAMSPTDGSWGGTNEVVNAIMDTSGLAEGKHYILVHGKNQNSIWGPYTAVFLDITTPLKLTAKFTSNSPVFLGQPMNFINQTSGGMEPITYFWDFGDSIGTSTEPSPTYIYTDTGIFTVTLITTDTLQETDAVSHTVTVEPAPITSVDLIRVTTDPIFVGDMVGFTADLLPDTATKPYSYTLDFGDGTVITGTSDMDPLLFDHVFNTGGGYTVQISVQNAVMSESVTDSIDVYVNYKIFLPLTTK
jgi:PKD repeat protein